MLVVSTGTCLLYQHDLLIARVTLTTALGVHIG